MLQHQQVNPLSAALTLQQCLSGDTEERHHQPIDRSGLTPAYSEAWAKVEGSNPDAPENQQRGVADAL
ncbi:hypothetical protein TNCV_2968521 [Trichonephila clavipes]|nr:hypothetical protein TNCV_2968521 [Trichonephila clavipes]